MRQQDLRWAEANGAFTRQLTAELSKLDASFTSAPQVPNNYADGDTLHGSITAAYAAAAHVDVGWHITRWGGAA